MMLCFLSQYSFEALFRSQHFALLDNCCREYLFLCDFFLVTGSAAKELFTSVMGKVVTLFGVSDFCVSYCVSYYLSSICCLHSWKIRIAIRRVVVDKFGYIKNPLI